MKALISNQTLRHSLVLIGLGMGTLVGCEGGQVVTQRHNAAKTDASEISNSDDEGFSLELHKDKIAKKVKHAKDACPAGGMGGGTVSIPALPQPVPESPIDSVKGHKVSEVETLAIYLCSKTPDQYRALRSLAKSLTPDQLANIGKFDPIAKAEVTNFKDLDDKTFDGLLGLYELLCPAADQAESSSSKPSVFPSNPVTTNIPIGKGG